MTNAFYQNPSTPSVQSFHSNISERVQEKFIRYTIATVSEEFYVVLVKTPVSCTKHMNEFIIHM